MLCNASCVGQLSHIVTHCELKYACSLQCIAVVLAFNMVLCVRPAPVQSLQVQSLRS